MVWERDMVSLLTFSEGVGTILGPCGSYNHHSFLLVLGYIPYELVYHWKRWESIRYWSDQIWCITSVPWLYRSRLHVLYRGNCADSQEVKRSISGFSLIWQILWNTCVRRFHSKWFRIPLVSWPPIYLHVYGAWKIFCSNCDPMV